MKSLKWWAYQKTKSAIFVNSRRDLYAICENFGIVTRIPSFSVCVPWSDTELRSSSTVFTGNWEIRSGLQTTAARGGKLSSSWAQRPRDAACIPLGVESLECSGVMIVISFYEVALFAVRLVLEIYYIANSTRLMPDFELIFSTSLSLDSKRAIIWRIRALHSPRIPWIATL